MECKIILCCPTCLQLLTSYDSNCISWHIFEIFQGQKLSIYGRMVQLLVADFDVHLLHHLWCSRTSVYNWYYGRPSWFQPSPSLPFWKNSLVTSIKVNYHWNPATGHGEDRHESYPTRAYFATSSFEGSRNCWFRRFRYTISFLAHSILNIGHQTTNPWQINDGRVKSQNSLWRQSPGPVEGVSA